MMHSRFLLAPYILLLVFTLSCSFKPSGTFVRQTRGGEKPAETVAALTETSVATKDVNTLSFMHLRQGRLLWVIPILSSLLAFLSFKNVTRGFHSIVEAMSHNHWSPSSEAELNLQTEVITQVVNGPVITSISVLFATLVSTTISFLHDRQITMKSLFDTQIEELRILQVMLSNMPESAQEYGNRLVREHSERLVRNESAEERDTIETVNESLYNLLLLLQAQVASEGSSPVAQMAFECVTRIQQAESKRLTALETKFPVMHYTTLSLLVVAICISFLVATDSSLLIFESLQVRILWTILIGAFTSLAVVCYDLSLPFLGAYKLSPK